MARLLTVLTLSLALGAPAGAEDVAAPAAAAAPELRLGGVPLAFSGQLWIDTGFLLRDNTQPGVYDEKDPYLNGRFVLGVEYRRSVGDLTATARAELLGLAHEFRDAKYEPHAQDVYFKLAGARWDLQVGRFLGTEVYYRGQGIELYTAEEAGAKNGPPLYHLNLARGQADGVGQVAVHWRPSDRVTLELGSLYGLTSAQGAYGARPVVDVSLGGLRVVAGYEWVRYQALLANDKARSTAQGFGGRVQYTLRGVTAGVDYARRADDVVQIDGLADAARSGDLQSVGGFVDAELWRGSLGLGYHYTTQDNDKSEHNWHQQAFVSYLYRLPIDGLSAKAVFGFARASIENVDNSSTFENDLQSFRIRILYEFR